VVSCSLSATLQSNRTMWHHKLASTEALSRQNLLQWFLAFLLDSRTTGKEIPIYIRPENLPAASSSLPCKPTSLLFYSCTDTLLHQTTYKASTTQRQLRKQLYDQKLLRNKKTNPVALSPQANYTD
jgi:hypothetical protein